MNEAQCTRVAVSHVYDRHWFSEAIHWSGEFADYDRRKPDKLVLVLHHLLKQLFAGPYFLHAIESKTDRRYFVGLFDNQIVDAVEQALDYHANAKWLAVAHHALDDEEWRLLAVQCRSEGLGLIHCRSAAASVLVEPAHFEGQPWCEYPGLIREMRRQRWNPECRC